MKKWEKEHRDKMNLWKRRCRHKKGISKKYNEKYGGVRKDRVSSYNAEYRKAYRLSHKIQVKRYGQKYKALRKEAGLLTVAKIQMVYEDNIKKYGTLTCYLCEKPISFGKDSLEHKTPLSRGGTNAYENLAIAHLSCNHKKKNKTLEEYRMKILNKQGK